MTGKRRIKDKLFEQFARIGQAMSSSKRLELLDLLCQCAKDVETLAGNTGMSVANTSRHLQILKAAGLVESQKEGVHNIYCLSNREVADLYCGFRDLAEKQLADVERIVEELYPDEERMEPVNKKQLIKLAKAGAVTVLDVRPEDEYRAAHLPHAISVPLPKLKGYLKKLPKHRKVVAYCRGPYCLMATEAIHLLQNKGYKAIRIGEGIIEWQAAGLPLIHES